MNGPIVETLTGPSWPVTHERYPHQQVTYDSVNPRYPYEGSDFFSVCQETFYHDVWGVRERTFGSPRKNEGWYRVKLPEAALDIEDFTTFEECELLGPQAWNKFRPAKPKVSMGVAIAELRDAPQLLFKKLDSFRNLGNNYLAVEFGWKPFLSDLMGAYENWRKIDRQVTQLMRDNGRWIRRKGPLYKHEETEIVDDLNAGAIMLEHNTFFMEDPDPYGKYIYTTTEEAWFSGRFRYYIPELKDPKWGKLKAIRDIYGLELTPNEVYQLIPFSWLIDWFTNLGDVVANLSAQISDHLVAKYAYVMLQKSITTEAEVTFTLHRYCNEFRSWIPTETKVITPKALRKETWKCRASANPFGFGITFTDLSLWQMSILGALGLTKSRF